MMGFSAKQLQALRRNVEERHIRTRQSNRRELSYIEGWYAIAQANQIFGFDGWNRETLETKCVLARDMRGAFTAVYTAKVRITVKAEGAVIIREGHGTGESHAGSPGEVHDTALKAAETDATKRALATFGRPFGLELYRNGRIAVEKASSTRNLNRSAAPRTARVGAGTEATATGVAVATAGREGTPATSADALKLVVKPASSLVAPGTAGQQSGSTPSGVVPSDSAPIPRPSRHYGRQRYLDNREQNATLMQEAQRRATEASLVPSQPDLLPPKIDKSALTFGEPKRLRDKAHLKFVGSQPCLVCGRQPADAHHLRFAQPRALGLKVSDEFTVPLCRGHHRAVHQTGNEPAWWEDLEINALEIARSLWEQSRGLNKAPASSELNMPEKTEPSNSAAGPK